MARSRFITVLGFKEDPRDKNIKVQTRFFFKCGGVQYHSKYLILNQQKYKYV